MAKYLQSDPRRLPYRLRLSRIRLRFYVSGAVRLLWSLVVLSLAACASQGAVSVPEDAPLNTPTPITRTPFPSPTPPPFDMFARTNPSDLFYVYPSAVLQEIPIVSGSVQQGTLRVGDYHYAAYNRAGARSSISQHDLDWNLVDQLSFGPASELLFDEFDTYEPHLGSLAFNSEDGHIYVTVLDLASRRTGLVKVSLDPFRVGSTLRTPQFTYLDAIEFHAGWIYLPYDRVIGRMRWSEDGPDPATFRTFYIAPPWGIAQTIRIRNGKLYLVPENGGTPDEYEGIAVFALDRLIPSRPDRKLLNFPEYYYRIPLPLGDPDNEGLDLSPEDPSIAYATSAHGDTVWKIKLEGE